MRNGGWKCLLAGWAIWWIVTGCAAGPDREAEQKPPSASEQAGPRGDGVDEARARTTYDNNCAACHGANLEGSFGPALKGVGQKYSKEEIDEIIRNGRGQMPAQRQMSDADRENLAAWLAEQG